jgi:hypothetical protein
MSDRRSFAHPLTRWLRLALGVAFLIGGGALLYWIALRTDLALSTATSGLPLLNLIAVALGLAALGAGADFLGLWRRRDALPKVRNTKVYGAAEPASEREAKAAAHGETRAPLHDRTFSE